MANINALIAAGPHTRGFDVKGALGGIEALKYAKTRNALADIGLQQAPKNIARADRDDAQAQDAYVRTTMIQSAQDFLAQHQASGGGDTISSSTWAVLDRLPDTPEFAAIKASAAAARQTKTKVDDLEVLRNAQGVAAMGEMDEQEDERTAHIKDFQFGQAILRRYGAESQEYRAWWDTMRQNYSWQDMGGVPTPASNSNLGPTLGGNPVGSAPTGNVQQTQMGATQPIAEGGIAQPEIESSANVPQTPAEIAASNAAIIAGAKEGAKLNEQRFNKIVNDAPQHTKMAGFIRQVSESVLRASDKIKNIIKDNPNTAIGLGSQFSVQRTAEGGTKQVNWPGSWDEPAIQVDTLINQMFGGAAFATLQQMRQASPTGGALGQVSNFEINLLQNQWAAFSQRAGDSKFAIGQMDEMMEQAQLVSDLANVEIGVQQRIQALGPDTTKEQIAELINAGFKNMADVYKRHERDSGSWDNDTLTWTPSEKTVAGEENEGKKDALDLTNQTITTQEQYDALPSGAIYTGKDGKTYRKP